MKQAKLMNVLFYGTGAAGERLEQILRGLVSEDNLEICKTFDGLSERLRYPKEDTPVAVILAENEDDLLMILVISRLLYDLRFILILPDRDEPTIAIGHSLRPRYLSYSDSDFSDVAAVLGRMIAGSYHSRGTKNLNYDRHTECPAWFGYQPHDREIASYKRRRAQTTMVEPPVLFMSLLP
jgi:hypothetical protein